MVVSEAGGRRKGKRCISFRQDEKVDLLYSKHIVDKSILYT